VGHQNGFHLGPYQRPEIKRGYANGRRFGTRVVPTEDSEDLDCSRHHERGVDVNAVGEDVETLSSEGWYAADPITGFAFRLVRGRLNDSDDAKLLVAGFLIHGLAHENYLLEIYRKHGFENVAIYLADRAFADKVSTRIGDFGEIVAGRLLEAEEGFTRPVEKLRYKDNHNWPMRLTDVFCINRFAGQISGFVFCEVKAGTSPPVRELAVVDYKKLIVDSQSERPEILFFASEHLWAEGQYELYQQLDYAMYQNDPLPRATRMVLIFDDNAWREIVLQDLDDALNNGDVSILDDFICYLVTKDELRDFIEDTYKLAEQGAKDL